MLGVRRPTSFTAGHAASYDSRTGRLIDGGAGGGGGGTTVGNALSSLATPGAASFLRINNDGSVSELNPADTRTALGLSAAATAPPAVRYIQGPTALAAATPDFVGQLAVQITTNNTDYFPTLFIGHATSVGAWFEVIPLWAGGGSGDYNAYPVVDNNFNQITLNFTDGLLTGHP